MGVIEKATFVKSQDFCLCGWGEYGATSGEEAQKEGTYFRGEMILLGFEVLLAIQVEMSKKQLNGIFWSCSRECEIEADCGIIAVKVVDTVMSGGPG